MDKQLVMRFWSVPPEEVPAGEEARIAWLYDWWARIDAWIEEHRPAPRPLSTDWTARRTAGRRRRRHLPPEAWCKGSSGASMTCGGGRALGRRPATP